MKIKSCKKNYKEETHRAIPISETLEWIEPKVMVTGITRVAEITALDRIGIPVFSCIRPTAEAGAITVYNGKGATEKESRVSAIMEGIERYSSELHEREIIMETYSDLSQKENTLNPCDLILPTYTNLDRPLPWYPGYDLSSDTQIWIPASAVFHPLPQRMRSLMRTNTNGLASGNTHEEAIFHALCEVIERDAWSLVEETRDTGPTLTGLSDPVHLSLKARFTEAQVDLQIKEITSDIGLPTIAAVADDLSLKDPALLTIGMGTHTSARVAVIRALTEVAQSRLTQIHGAREDTTLAELRKKMGYERAKRINAYWFRHNSDRDYSMITSYDTPDFESDITSIMGRLRSVGLDRVIVVDLTREEIGVPVVRVIVPGLEVSAIDPERRGERVKNAEEHRLSRPES